MKKPRLGLLAAGCVLAAAMLAMPQGLQGQAGGNGQAGPGHGPFGAPGKATPMPVDPGRPWGWAVKGPRSSTAAIESQGASRKS